MSFTCIVTKCAIRARIFYCCIHLSSSVIQTKYCFHTDTASTPICMLFSTERKSQSKTKTRIAITNMCVLKIDWGLCEQLA